MWRREQPPEETIYLTGELLPGSEDPDELLEKLYAPLVAVDIEATDHQKIYEEPSTKSAVLGTVHGQPRAWRCWRQAKISPWWAYGATRTARTFAAMCPVTG